MSASDPSSEGRITRTDRAVWGAGLVVVMGLAVALWSQAGREVFSAMMTGLLALCF
jgi:hypothetical protein